MATSWQTTSLYSVKNASYCLNIAPKWGDSVFELFCCHLETHFEVIQEKSAHVNPSTPCEGLQSMLYLCAVSGLVISRMEDILEHGCLDIVAFLPFLERDVDYNRKNLVNYLKSKLESHKVPVLYGEIAEVRRTFNGKIDRKSYR